MDEHAAGLTHLTESGEVHMVDVSAKSVAARTAIAEAHVALSRSVREMVFSGELPKGDALAVVRVAAIMGAKSTPQLIPLCHPVGLDAVEVEVEPTETGARIVVTARVEGRTGVEMEAMTGAAVGAVTLYDMIKGVDRGAVIGPVQLLSKSGGSSGEWRR
ncbi:MAG: cyclic pyranopterin monophosphate synthase MoaC [Acidimicrobiia bacterium]|nr:cyclic pyranopterin monophosphate synthase MoaC [Acidimicrobiia bacterium]